MSEIRNEEQLPQDLVAIAEQLDRQRPVPSPAFRGELGRRLHRKEPGMRSLSPVVLKRRIAALGGSGVGLLAIAALGTAGVGPLAS